MQLSGLGQMHISGTVGLLCVIPWQHHSRAEGLGAQLLAPGSLRMCRHWLYPSMLLRWDPGLIAGSRT